MKCNYQFSSVPESGVIAVVEGALLRLFFDITEAPKARAKGKTADDDGEPGEPDIPVYDCIQVDVKSGRSYADIVGAIVNDRYSADDVQAILANHSEANDGDSDLADDKREEYMAEYAEFQQWRRHAKEIAVIALEQINQ